MNLGFLMKRYLGGSSFHGKWFKDLTYWSERLSVLATQPIRVLNTGFPDGSVVKNLTTSASDTGSILRSGRSPRAENGTPLQYSCQEYSVGRGAWWVILYGVKKSLTWVSDWAQQSYNNSMFPYWHARHYAA